MAIVSAGMKLSVIVLAWNGRQYLGPCLRSLQEQQRAQQYGETEIIVVDNASTDGSADWVADNFPAIRLIRNTSNLGFAAGNNVGLRAATGDAFVLFNQDTVAHPACLDALTTALEDHSTGLVGCKLVYPDGAIQHAGGYLQNTRGDTAHVGWRERDQGQYDQAGEADFVTGACIAVTRSNLERIGLLDEGFSPAYFEDIDWCYRAHALGLRVVYWPAAVVTHYESSSTRGDLLGQRYAFHQGRLRLVFKHYPLDRLLNEFGPAELSWAAVLDRNDELMATRRAYLNTVLLLCDIAAFRHSTAEECAAMLDLLGTLRDTTLGGLMRLQLSRALAPVTSPDPPASAASAASPVHLAEPAPPEPQPTQAQPSPATQPSVAQQQPRAETPAPSARFEPLSLVEMEARWHVREQAFISRVPVIGALIVAVGNLWNAVSTKWYVRALTQQQNDFNAQVVTHLRHLQNTLLQMQAELLDQRAILEQHGRSFVSIGEAFAQYNHAFEDLGKALAQHDRTFEQHGHGLAHLYQLSQWLSQRIDQLEQRSGEQGAVLEGQLRDIAENIREISMLARHVARQNKHE